MTLQPVGEQTSMTDWLYSLAGGGYTNPNGAAIDSGPGET